jgi:hypothetical protein
MAMDQENQRVLKLEKENKRRRKCFEEHPELDDSVNAGL